eukprot:CAMPEP_0179061024 /NCGR_PEP_ID=MMETSP0796-20121207/26168_1 /TAXON_ID=73915 /ORGANISM="Pyrodinium bahamense, Strain pbaha01" /LENGTH=69 /DNA_ID=CAMNT_0020757825 /DNA_START=318 /DNA_END=527 /DNA_ORIENTATION=-
MVTSSEAASRCAPAKFALPRVARRQPAGACTTKTSCWAGGAVGTRSSHTAAAATASAQRRGRRAAIARL